MCSTIEKDLAYIVSERRGAAGIHQQFEQQGHQRRTDRSGSQHPANVARQLIAKEATDAEASPMVASPEAGVILGKRSKPLQKEPLGGSGLLP